MRSLFRRSLPLVLTLGTSAAGFGCSGAAAPDGVGESAAASSEAATLTFDASYNENSSGPLRSGGKFRVVYEEARARCTGSHMGRPAYTVTMHYRFNDGAVQTAVVAGARPDSSTEPPVLDLAAPGTLEMWFQSTNRWGCNEWDSDFGQNYRFTVLPGDAAAHWMGNARFGIARGSACGSTLCEADYRPLEGGFAYDTWARQRAAITEAVFDVYKPGVTDGDNSNIAQELDVKVHYKYYADPREKVEAVRFQKRTGNNARFALNLRGYDPFRAPGTPPANCPETSVQLEGDDAVVSLSFYFSVNGVQLRPAGGGEFRGKYIDHVSSWQGCPFASHRGR
jgi:hypothetical protein